MFTFHGTHSLGIMVSYVATWLTRVNVIKVAQLVINSYTSLFDFCIFYTFCFYGVATMIYLAFFYI